MTINFIIHIANYMYKYDYVIDYKFITTKKKLLAICNNKKKNP